MGTILERHVKNLRQAQKDVILTFEYAGGHVILWRDKKGHTVTRRGHLGISVGQALSLRKALDEFQEFVDEAYFILGGIS